MRAVVADGSGGPEVLSVQEVPDLEPGPGEVLVATAATAVNRADVLQRQGFYPPPPGASDVIGLECSGTIAALGDGVEGWAVGDEVCALLAGGGYASQVVVPAGQLMPVPAGLDLVTAAAVPEVACTVWSNVFMVAALARGDAFLVHGGAGGIGTFAIQLASALGARVFTTGGSAEKLAFCRDLGADVTINYRDEDFLKVVRAETDGRGIDVVLDNMGGKYLRKNVDALASEGRLVIIGMQGGIKAELNIATLLNKRGAVIATSLRGRPLEGKAAICASVVEHVWPLVADGSMRPVIDTMMPLDDVRGAHELMDAGSQPARSLLDRRDGSPGGAVCRHERRRAPDRGARSPSRSSRSSIIGPDGKAIGAVPASALAGASEGGGRRGGRRAQPHRPRRAAGEGHAHRQHDQAAARGGEGRSARRGQPQPPAGDPPASIKELEDGLAPELVEELERLSLPFADETTPSEAELRIAQAQLVGWLEGLFHGIQTALDAQQMAARAQFEQMRRALPPGAMPPGMDPGQMAGGPGHPGSPGSSDDDTSPGAGGMYL